MTCVVCCELGVEIRTSADRVQSGGGKTCLDSLRIFRLASSPLTARAHKRPQGVRWSLFFESTPAMDFSAWLEFGGQVQETKRATGAAVDRVFTAPDGGLFPCFSTAAVWAR